MQPPKAVLRTLEQAERVLILIHPKPDGDAIGSAVAMGRGLKALGKQVDYFVDPDIEHKLRFFDEIRYFTSDPAALKKDYDVLLLLDVSTADYAYKPDVLPDYGKLVVIDHHKSNAGYGDENFVAVTGAAGELVYLTLKALGAPFDDEMREAVYTALSTDTGSFRFSNTTAQTHEIAAALHEGGRSYAPLSRKLHAEKTLNQMKLYGAAIENLSLTPEGKAALIVLDYPTLEKYGGAVNVTDDISNIGVNINTTVVSMLAKETEPGVYKLSLRSKSPYAIDVSRFAVEHGGGGHYRAAGCTVEGTRETLEHEIYPAFTALITDQTTQKE